MPRPPFSVQFERVSFSHDAKNPVVRDVSLDCAAGETLAVVGRSGAGKSTLMKLVNRLLEPSSGTVRVQEQPTTSWDPTRLRRSIGYVMQDAALFPHMTVEQNIAVVPRLEGWPEERVGGRVRELLEMVGLDARTYAARRPSELSGGQRQRVGLARALAVDPPVLLMDEPFGALDPMTRREVRREFVRLRHRLETTTMVVTHDVAEAFALGDRIAVMEAGEVIALGTPAALRESSDTRIRALLEDVP